MLRITQRCCAVARRFQIREGSSARPGGRRKLGRKSSHRRALLRTQVTQLIQHDVIHTTLPKAKELRRIADRMVKYAKRGTQHDWNMANAYVRDKTTVSKLFAVLGPRYRLREGGYTRVLRTQHRKGDNAAMAMIEFVDREGELRPAKAVKLPATLEDLAEGSSMAAAEAEELQQA